MSNNSTDKNIKKVLIFVILVAIAIVLFYVNNILKNEFAKDNMELELKLPFYNGGFINKKYTCEGEDINPWILIENYEEIKNKSNYLAVIVEDPDAPLGTFTHWLAWNIPLTNKIEEGSSKKNLYDEGYNDFGKIGYNGPCPPPGTPHRYYFYVYAYKGKLNLSQNISREELKKILENKALFKGEYYGIFER